MGNKQCCNQNQEKQHEHEVTSTGLPNNNQESRVSKEIHDKSFSDEEDDHKNTDSVQNDIASKLAQKNQKGIKKKMGISAEAYGTYNQQKAFVAQVIPKTAEQQKQIKATLAKSFMFSSLEPNEQQIVIDAMKIKSFKNNEHVIKQGDEGNELYILYEGSLKCEKIFPGNTEPTFLKNYVSGEVFGELSLLYNTPRAASIISTGDSTCFSLDRETFNHIVKNSAIQKRELYETFLKKVTILQGLDHYERSKICDCLKTESFSKGDYVIRQGDEGDKLYFVKEGVFHATKNSTSNKEDKVFQFKDNDYFGELALINNDKRQANIVVESTTGSLVSIDKNSFKRLLGPIEEIMKRNAGRYDLK